jgi:hypothetical protein
LGACWDLGQSELSRVRERSRPAWPDSHALKLHAAVG